MDKQKKTKDLKIRGSITVEAALILPVMIFALTGMLFLIQVLNFQQKVQYALTKTAWEASEYAVVYQDFENHAETEDRGETEASSEADRSREDAEADSTREDDGLEELMTSLVGQGFYATTMAKYLDREELENSCILGGIWGIRYTGSSFLEQEEQIEVVASYRIRIPLPLISFASFPIRQRAVSRGFLGSNSWDGSLQEDASENAEASENTELVYVTKTGKRYHCRQDCTYLQFSVHDVAYEQIEEERNASGACYYPCEACVDPQKQPAKVFLTDYGTRYHALLSCVKLKRVIYEEKKENAVREGKSPCSKCAK